MKPRLSILIASIPTRIESLLVPLLKRLEADIGDLPVQTLWLGDNRSVSVGQKRQMLLDIATGEYLTWLDDDDEFELGAVRKIVAAICANPGVDVVCYDEWCHINDDPPKLVRFGVGFPNTDIGVENPTRAVWHNQTWRTELARRSTFPDCSFGEDFAFCLPLQPLIQSSVKIEEPLRRYRFRHDTTATQ